ncbi:MAG TPA: zinc-binding dehydrogenase, partial [Kofleriaceae bacterium]
MGQRVVIHQLAADPLEAIEHATLEPMAMPENLGPRDVVIEVKSAAAGWVDLIMASGQYQHVPAPPYTPGLEYAGTVAWTGPEVNTVNIGQRVLVDPFLAGPRSSGSYRNYGGFASYAVAPADAVHAIPGALTFDQACNLLGNYETAYHCLIARGHLRAGETVLIHGASGSVGLAAVHVAKLVGATVIATGRSQDKLAVVKAQGADHVIGTTNLKTDVKALTGGRGADVVYDGVGGDISVESL